MAHSVALFVLRHIKLRRDSRQTVEDAAGGKGPKRGAVRDAVGIPHLGIRKTIAPTHRHRLGSKGWDGDGIGMG